MANHREAGAERRTSVKLPKTAGSRARLSAATAAAALAVLSGCVNVGTASGGQSPTPLPGTAQPAAGDHPATVAPAIPTGDGPGSLPVVGKPSAIMACTGAQLKVTRGTPDAGAGQLYVPINFTNASKAACSLSGYPGVSYVAEDGVQSGNAAERTKEAASTVTLKPGVTAVALMRDSNGVGGNDPKSCGLDKALGLRVYPPNLETAVFLPWPVAHCAGPAVHSLSIGPVKLG
ncbi:hypothetical protein Pth03_48740 [Planotetraspora thailandica]|uniref:DUF4232 domain-containing protein n=1 Tax=Planotetraspora thailandica TaxID=487172 RepID=A0A8J3V5L2_9ACTN|nr:DUF4232 domain-containing protein [Planotetraspora thailandica]GII56485.1 hypothetical protein Pth03_48740 [Planotetraspora thailandica]